MNSLIPPKLNEAGSGAVFLMTLFFAIFLATWLYNTWKKNPKRHIFRTYEVKAAFGLFTMFCGLTAKVGAEWWFLHLKNQGQNVSYPIMVPLFVFGTLVSLWGMVCLMRSLAPYEWGATRWFWLFICALAFGIFFAI